jgi:hypothetical protein
LWSSLVLIGPVVSEEKIFEWKVYDGRTTDAKWWQKLTLATARWAKKSRQVKFVRLLVCWNSYTPRNEVANCVRQVRVQSKIYKLKCEFYRLIHCKFYRLKCKIYRLKCKCYRLKRKFYRLKDDGRKTMAKYHPGYSQVS